MDNIEETLLKLPDLVAQALENWRIATLQREKVEALIHLAHKGSDEKKTMADIKAIIHSDRGRYDAVILEIKAEAQYIRLYEELLSAKKRAALRTAF